MRLTLFSFFLMLTFKITRNICVNENECMRLILLFFPLLTFRINCSLWNSWIHLNLISIFCSWKWGMLPILKLMLELGYYWLFSFLSSHNTKYVILYMVLWKENLCQVWVQNKICRTFNVLGWPGDAWITYLWGKMMKRGYRINEQSDSMKTRLVQDDIEKITSLKEIIHMKQMEATPILMYKSKNEVWMTDDLFVFFFL